MNLGELIEQFRIDTDDNATPYLWSDAALKRWFNEAEEEACRRSELLVDSSTPSITRVVAAKDDAWIPYDDRIIRILRARPVGQFPVPVLAAHQMDFEQYSPRWEEETGDKLLALISDMETFKLRTYPIVNADVEIDLTVQRIPKEPMARNDDKPEIHRKYHLKLIHWVKYKAYSVPDVDTASPEDAATELRMFEREFGGMTTSVENRLRRHGGRDIKTGFFA